MEEAGEITEVGKENEAAVHGELLSRIQEMEDELKDSERKRLDLIHGNMALQLKLKVSQEEEGRIRQEMASLEEKQLSVLRSKVRRLMGLIHQTNHQECCV